MNQYIALSLSIIKKYKIKISCICAGVIVLLVLINILSHLGTNKRVFIYPMAGSSRYKKEVRYLNSDPVQGKISYYVDELVLGPSFYRGKKLFTAGTKVEYCFLRDKTLFVGLSPEAVLQEAGAVELSEGVKLFKKNIKKNFTGIKTIELFIDGNFIGD